MVRGRSFIIVATMNFAERMSRLGTESAFEVLARAKALERQFAGFVPEGATKP